MRIFKSIYFHHSDIRLILALLVLAAVSAGFLVLTDGLTDPAAADGDSTAVIAKDKRYTDRRHRQTDGADWTYATEGRPAERFAFDPNTADSTTLLRLGLQPWQVRNIYRYRAKGGIYRKPSDFARLYGLTRKQYRELEPYIRISDDYLPAADLPEARARQAADRDTTLYPKKLKAQERIVLNTADTNALKRIPGIGSYYARRIVSYGERLGGYVSLDQLDEIDDLPEGVKQYLVISHPHTQRMNINRLKLNQLKRHPYMSFFRAKTLTEYRRLHGAIHSLEELRFSTDFTQEAIDRLAPYVEY